MHSVLNALNYLSQIADEDDWVLVHDAARPCVTFECLNTLVKMQLRLIRVLFWQFLYAIR